MKRTEWEIDVRAIGESLALGQSAGGLICPECKGGRNRDRAFVVTRTETGYLYCCHRASCPFKGYVSRYGGGDEESRNSTRHSPLGFASGKIRKYAGRLEPLPAAIQQTLHDVYHFDQGCFDRGKLKWAVEDERLWMPCIRWDGVETGAQARKLDGTKPKVLTYHEGDRPGMAWYQASKGAPFVLVVEDQLSAIRASEFVPTVSLLGTNLNWDRVCELAAVTQQVYLALDKDATDKAYEYRKKYSAFLPITVVMLERDLKNLNPDELQEKLKELK